MIHKLSSQDEYLKKAVIIGKVQRAVDLTSAKYLYDRIQVIIDDLINNQYELKDIVSKLMSVLGKNEDGAKCEVINECIEAVKELTGIESRSRDTKSKRDRQTKRSR